MNNIFFSKAIFSYMHKNASSKSEVVSEILYGEKFKILSKNKHWIKIKTSFDNYIGYIKNKNYIKQFKPTHKIYSLKAKIFTRPISKKIYESGKCLSFATRISSLCVRKKFIEYEKNKWIKKSDVKKNSHREKDYLKIFNLFLKTKYVWGGKTYNGIDCSALLQLFFFYNEKFFPRDTKEQIKNLKKNIKKHKKGCIIFWTGHVAICVNNKNLIHAFGPKKKVLIMNIKKTISEIKNNSKLSVMGKKNINDH